VSAVARVANRQKFLEKPAVAEFAIDEMDFQNPMARTPVVQWLAQRDRIATPDLLAACGISSVWKLIDDVPGRGRAK
jgi:hypothetical protein